MSLNFAGPIPTEQFRGIENVWRGFVGSELSFRNFGESAPRPTGSGYSVGLVQCRIGDVDHIRPREDVAFRRFKRRRTLVELEARNMRPLNGRDILAEYAIEVAFGIRLVAQIAERSCGHFYQRSPARHGPLSGLR